MEEGGPSSLVALTAATNPQSQILALRSLKDEIVGRETKKEIAVRHGVLDQLCEILSSIERSSGKKARLGTEGSIAAHTRQWTTEDELRLQAVLVVGILANAGTRFIASILATGVTGLLVSIISDDTAPRLVTAVLQALRSIAAAFALLHAQPNPSMTPVPLLRLFTRDTAETVFRPILLHRQGNSTTRQQMKLLVETITFASTDQLTRGMMVSGEVLDALAELLVAYGVEQRYIEWSSLYATLPSAPSHIMAAKIMDAIAAIIADSTYSTHKFILSLALRMAFMSPRLISHDQRHLLGPRYGFVAFGQPLLPPLHIPTHVSASFHQGISRAFPTLSALNSHSHRRGGIDDAMCEGCDTDHANAVCGYLILLARTFRNHDRLIAFKLLALVIKAIDAEIAGSNRREDSIRKCKEREKQVTVLAIPLLVQLVQDANETKTTSMLEREAEGVLRVKEQACSVLATLINGKLDFQTAAVEAGAIKHVCAALKRSFDPVSLAKPVWQPNRIKSDAINVKLSCQVAPHSFPPEILHAMRCRESALEAIAALAAKDDLHRKSIVEAGVVPCVIDALKPLPDEYFAAAPRSQPSPRDGNTIPVVLAACTAARSMSRSVAALRTSLIDAGLGKPILELMTHRSVEVQIAATNVCANLVLEFSALREDFLGEATVRMMAEHAHSSLTTLRLPSLWALKHLVLSAPKEIKLRVLEELGADWLIDAIQGQHHPVGTYQSVGSMSVGLSTPNAAGEQVDLLNPSSMDLDVPVAGLEFSDRDEGSDVRYHANFSAESLPSPSPSHYNRAPRPHSTLENQPSALFDSTRFLAGLQDRELNTTRQAQRDDVAIQEQALDFVRNLLNGPDDCVFMFDHLIAQIGSFKLFELLTSKLAPIPPSGLQVGGSVPIYHPVELILSSVHIINHIANCSVRHKQLLIDQKPLLQAWLPHFNHGDRRIRVHSVWAVNSLTWTEHDHERGEGRRRVRDLRAIGIESAVRSLQNDPDLDVRERVKTAIRQIELLSG